MNDEILKEAFDSIFRNALAEFKIKTPIDTGHLRRNATKGIWLSNTHYRIYIDRNIIENVANPRGIVAGYYYPQYINDEPRFKTYKWIDKAVNRLVRVIAKESGGKIRR